MNDQADIIGLFKRTYSTRINDLTRQECPITDLVPFEDKIGENFDQPVDLRFEHAFTSAVNTVTPGAGGTAGYGGYLEPIAGLTDRALVTPFSVHGRASVNYNSIMESQGSDKAFANATAHIVKRMTRSHAKRNEIHLLRGRTGIGVIESGVDGGAASSAVITAGSWAEGLWSGMVGARLDVYLTTGVKSGQTTLMTITAVNPATRTISISGTAGATGTATLIAGSYFTFETATIAGAAANTNEMPGLKFWARNTGALFNLNAGTEPLWAGNIASETFGTPSLSKLLDALTAPSSYGLNNALSVAIVSPRCFNTMVSDQAALRRFPASEKTGRNGFSYLEFNCQTGVLRLQPHAYQSDGEIDIFCPDSTKRIGSNEIDFIQRKGSSERLILDSATSPSAEMRTNSNLTLFCEFPRHIVTAAGVTY